MFFKDSLKFKERKRWICGRSIDGSPCQKGPDSKGNCVSNHECDPYFEGDRWYCTRDEQQGGPCIHGPLPDGSCSLTRPYCTPTQSVTDRLYRGVKWVTVVTAGLILLFLFGHPQEILLDPGPMSASHQTITDCSSCHEEPLEKGLSSTVEAALFSDKKAKLNNQCLNCHEEIKEFGSFAHNIEPLELKTFTARIRAKAPGKKTVDLEILHALTAPSHLEEGDISCAACHQEHKGRGFDILEMPPNRCNVCHIVKRQNLSLGHLEFSDYPHDQRTDIIYDHVSHEDKHYQEDEYVDRAPQSCTQCHIVDNEERMTGFVGYKKACAECHDNDITNSNQDSIAFLNIPYLDLQILQDQGHDIGSWPEDTEDDISPFMSLFLSADSRYRAYAESKEGIDLADLSGLDKDKLEIVEGLAWSIKELIYDMQIEGPQALKNRLESVLVFNENEDKSEPSFYTQMDKALEKMPFDSFDKMQQEWFPNLSEEVIANRSDENYGDPFFAAPLDAEEESMDLLDRISPQGGGANKSSTVDKSNIVDNQGDQGNQGNQDDFDDLNSIENIEPFAGDDLLSEWSDEDLSGFSEEDEEKENEDSGPKILDAHDWMQGGGWYFNTYSMAYRPYGHEDEFISEWAELTSRDMKVYSQEESKAVFSSLMLAGSSSPGACNKCHSVDKIDDKFRVHWTKKTPISLDKSFTSFSHKVHVTLMGSDECSKCHVVNKQSPYEKSFEDLDPKTFHSNYFNINKSMCTECHKPKGAKDSCTTCHNYHVRRFLEE